MFLVEILDKLIDRLIQLIQAHQTHKENLFNFYIEKVFEQFEKLHRFYLDSFSQYRMLLDDPQYNSNKMLQKIRHDNISSEHLRAKLSSMNQSISDDPFRNFSDLIRNYISSRNDSIGNILTFSQKWETYLVLELGIIWELEHINNILESDKQSIEIEPPSKTVEILKLYNELEEARTIRVNETPKIRRALDNIVAEMQVEYRQIVSEYSILRNRFSSPK
jgi:hypothetical protein